jgi:hypothetical protein
MSPGAQNMKTGPEALSTAENESGRAKHENEALDRSLFELLKFLLKFLNFLSQIIFLFF